MTELVTLTKSNPLSDLRRDDGTWSARDVQASGNVHADWRNWEASIKRGEVLLSQFGLVSAGQEQVVSATKQVPRGSGAAPQNITDYTLTALGLFAACQQSQLPELDIWFVFAGLQAAGFDGAEQVPAAIDNHDYWVSKGCVEFFANGRPKRFDPEYMPIVQITHLHKVEYWKTGSVPLEGNKFKDPGHYPQG